MNWKLLWFRMTGQRRRAGGVKAAQTRKDNEARKRMKPDATTDKPAAEAQMTPIAANCEAKG